MSSEINKHEMMVEMVNDIARQSPFLHMANLFRPHRVIGKQKVRLGSRFDGGYVMLDDFENISLALSFGVGGNPSWDIDIAQKGIPVWQFDHTIPAPPKQKNIEFYAEPIVPIASQDGRTIHEILKQAKITKDASVILKIDIEHDEWDVFDFCDEVDLTKFSQILVELHSFSQAKDSGWFARATRVLEKIHRHFATIHVHANNWCPMAQVSGVSFPEILEASLVNRSRYKVEYSDEVFPTSLDEPNNPLLPDLYLGTFRYGK